MVLGAAKTAGCDRHWSRTCPKRQHLWHWIYGEHIGPLEETC